MEISRVVSGMKRSDGQTYEQTWPSYCVFILRRLCTRHLKGYNSPQIRHKAFYKLRGNSEFNYCLKLL